jgi:general secretion pathway protein K
MNAARRSREGGFALVTVLWAAVILAAITASVLHTARREMRVANTRLMHAQLGALADAAISITILRMLDAHPAMQPLTDATPFAVAFGGRTIRVRVQDEAGRIDLNAAQPALLLRLLMAAGLGLPRAQRLVDNILDWREPGPGHHLNGADAADYAAAGLVYGPREGPFESVQELQLVMGMTPALYARVAPLLTIYSQTPWVDVGAAPPGVLDVLDLPAPPGPAAVKLGRVFTIVADLRGPRSARVRRTAIVQLTGSRRRPVLTYSWR